MVRMTFALLAAAALPAQDVVFRSDVSLVRVDAQVLGRDHRAITGLRAEDFELREGGRVQEIRNFSSENMPVDVLLLIDVSTSMRPHVQRLAGAAQQALRVLGDDDRVAFMVFDRSTRLRAAFRNVRSGAEREFERLLDQEKFNGGTDITRGLLDAAEHVRRNARAGARRAIVILTDDQTERDRNEEAVERALTRADAVLSALIAPDVWSHRGQPGGTYPGGRYPRSGGGSLGGIILGRRYPGGSYPGGQTGSRTRPAGTSEIARASGGDSMPVDGAGAFADTLSRIRQRYALHFYLPPGVKAGEERQIDVSLPAAARRRYPGAEVRFRRTYLAPTGTAPAGPGDPVVVSQSGAPAAGPDEPPRIRRRPAVDAVRIEDGPTPAPPSQTQSVEEQSGAPAPGKWRRLKPGEEP